MPGDVTAAQRHQLAGPQPRADAEHHHRQRRGAFRRVALRCGDGGQLCPLRRRVRRRRPRARERRRPLPRRPVRRFGEPVQRRPVRAPGRAAPGPPGPPRRTPRSRHSPAGTPGRPGLRGHQRTGTAPAAPWRSSPAAAGPPRRQPALAPARPWLPSRRSITGTSLKRIRLKPGAPETRAALPGSHPRHICGILATENRCHHRTPAQTRPGQRSRRPSARSASPCPARITIRHARCGKPRCACAADPPALHGPYIQWTRTVNGKTVTRLLTPAQYQAYAPWFANARRLRALAAELEALSLTEMARAEGWATITPGTQAAAPHQARPGPEPDSPYHPKRREISPLNAGTAHRRTHVAQVSRVLSLAHENWCDFPKTGTA